MKAPEDKFQSSLHDSAKKVPVTGLTDLPPLISYRALADASDMVATLAISIADGTRLPSASRLPMPKKHAGTRLITVLSPDARAAYSASTAALAEVLPSSSRKDFAEHEAFGSSPDRQPDEAVVDIDIAACYEYIRHSTLAEELLIQGANGQDVSRLIRLLGSIYPENRGIPQAMDESHLLADRYLSRMERTLVRSGIDTHRWADDFRLLSADRQSAHHAIEVATIAAQELGLTLSDGKTRIQTVASIRASLGAERTLFETYRGAAKDALGTIEEAIEDYDGVRTHERPPSGEEIDFEARLSIVTDWARTTRRGRMLSRLGSLALAELAPHDERISDEILVAIAESEPIRLQNIAEYVGSRGFESENWETLAKLTRLERLSPWAKAWLLSAASSTKNLPSATDDAFLDWSADQLRDDDEVVRAEASWLLASHDRLEPAVLGRLFVSATSVTRPGLAAASGLMKKLPDDLAQAICEDSSISKAAAKWGKLQRAT